MALATVDLPASRGMATTTKERPSSTVAHRVAAISALIVPLAIRSRMVGTWLWFESALCISYVVY
jgi:hypothetical protein